MPQNKDRKPQTHPSPYTGKLEQEAREFAPKFYPRFYARGKVIDPQKDVGVNFDELVAVMVAFAALPSEEEIARVIAESVGSNWNEVPQGVVNIYLKSARAVLALLKGEKP